MTLVLEGLVEGTEAGSQGEDEQVPTEVEGSIGILQFIPLQVRKKVAGTVVFAAKERNKMGFRLMCLPVISPLKMTFMVCEDDVKI